MAERQLVPFPISNDEDVSPLKRQRQVMQTTDSDLAGTIQNAMSYSLATQMAVHLHPIARSLQSLHDGQRAQNQKLAEMEKGCAQTHSTIADMQEAHSKRMDGLQAEILDLQKKVNGLCLYVAR